jgi:ABC-type transporter Mla subunit MlaD
MTNEEFNRRIEFLLNRQAAFEARMQHAEEVLPQHAAALSEVVDVLGTLTNTVVEGSRAVFDSLTRLSESMKDTDERMKHTEEKINALIDSQMRTDERFNRHLREQHGDLSGA